jgi:hypothetical protein
MDGEALHPFGAGGVNIFPNITIWSAGSVPSELLPIRNGKKAVGV